MISVHTMPTCYQKDIDSQKLPIWSAVAVGVGHTDVTVNLASERIIQQPNQETALRT